MILSHIYRIRKLLCERWDDLDGGKRAGEKTTTATTRHTIKLSLARLCYRSHLNSTWTIHPIVSHAAILNTRLNHIMSNYTYLIPSISRHSTHERVTIFWRNPALFRHTIRKRKVSSKLLPCPPRRKQHKKYDKRVEVRLLCLLGANIAIAGVAASRRLS